MIVTYRRCVYLYNIKDCCTEKFPGSFSAAKYARSKNLSKPASRCRVALPFNLAALCGHHSLAHHLFCCRIASNQVSIIQSSYLYLIFPLSKNLSRCDCRKYFVSSQRNPVWVEFSSPRCPACFPFFFYQPKQLTINSGKPRLILNSKICPA